MSTESAECGRDESISLAVAGGRPAEQELVGGYDGGGVEDGCDGDYQYDDGEEEEEVVMDEEEYLRMLDKMEPPLSVCQRLLRGDADGGGGGGSSGPWLVLSDAQRASLSRQGFAVVDGLAPASLAAEAYEEAISRAASGSLAPAHGGSTSNSSGGGGGGCSDTPDGRVSLDENKAQDNKDGSAEMMATDLTGYVKSVRDDLTAFVSSAQEMTTAAAAKVTGATTEVGAVGRTLAILATLGEDLGRMVRLKGRVEHQLAVYPAGINARYERHRDAYPDDGEDDDQDGYQSGENSSTSNVGEDARGEGDGAIGGSVSFRRITAICYLRAGQAPWQPSDGGALRLYPPAVTPPSVDGQAGGVDDSSGSGSMVVFKVDSQLGGSEGRHPQQEQGVITPGSQEIRSLDGCGGEENSSNGGGGGKYVEETPPIGGETRPVSSDDLETTKGSTIPPLRTAGGRDDENNYDCASGEHVGGIGRTDSSCERNVEAGAGGDGSCDGGGRMGVEGQQQAFVDVAPLAGRAVIFFSGAVEHEVLPVTGPLPRAALTTWFH